MTDFIIGLDEVGRGSLAGPVYVAVVAAETREFNARMFANNKANGRKKSLRLRDSKKLSPKNREIWYKHIKNNPNLIWAVASVGHKKIDKINISRAANLAATRVYNRLVKKFNGKCLMERAKIKVILDGGLYLNRILVKPKPNSLRTIIRGDEKYPCVALASIMAKVTRDRYMCRLAKKYPGYGLEIHKGYGTKKHRKALIKKGPSEIHRQSFTLA